MKNLINIFSFKGKYKILHMTWVAFFMTFLVWLGLGPLMPFIQESLQLTNQQAKVLLLLNVGMTIPARIVVGMLVDKYGPKILFSSILILGGIVSIIFSWMDSYDGLALMRFLTGFVGAGFVVGIRMISEWFPAKQTGIAQGIYGGWGNFGSAGAALSLPFIAGFIGGDDGWRYAITITSTLAIIYGFVYYINVSDTPKGSTYFKPRRIGAMEVSNKKDLLLYILLNIPLYLALSVIIWKLSDGDVGIIPPMAEWAMYIGLVVMFFYQSYKIIVINYDLLVGERPRQHQYKFKQVATLSMAYFISFGAELAIVSVLAMFYVDWFELSKIKAALLAGIYPFLNLFARPGGGWLSDTFGRRRTLIIAFAGMSISFLILGEVNEDWSIYAVIGLTIVGGIFSKAGSGAIFAMVPLIQRRLNGQIAGMVGAFGNTGAVFFLMMNSFISYDMLFYTIGIGATSILAIIVILLEEPKTSMVEVMDDGSVEIIRIR
jgi:NNP family nitrate/nitrite transporter-like MFS transporter